MIVSYNKKVALSLVLAAFFVSIDRLLKLFAVFNTNDLNLIGSLLKFNFTKNYYIAFSLPFAGPILLLLILAIIIILIIITAKFFQKRDITALPLIFVIAGSASNLFDRLKYGFVIDFIELKYFTVFNGADIMISFGLLVFLFILLKQKGPAEQAGQHI